jgi:hypothetical protein
MDSFSTASRSKNIYGGKELIPFLKQIIIKWYMLGFLELFKWF